MEIFYNKLFRWIKGYPSPLAIKHKLWYHTHILTLRERLICSEYIIYKDIKYLQSYFKLGKSEVIAILNRVVK